jgi:hypothetical protein
MRGVHVRCGEGAAEGDHVSATEEPTRARGERPAIGTHMSVSERESVPWCGCLVGPRCQRRPQDVHPGPRGGSVGGPAEVDSAQHAFSFFFSVFSSSNF